MQDNGHRGSPLIETEWTWKEDAVPLLNNNNSNNNNNKIEIAQVKQQEEVLRSLRKSRKASVNK